MANDIDTEVMSFFRKTQDDMMHRSTGVFVTSFSFSPQSDGFYLNVDMHIPDAIEQRDSFSFYGTPIQCVRQVQKKVEEEKERIKREL
jgi:hypothetical protein